MKTEQLKLIEIETPREAAERRHREYVARFRQEQAEARRKGLENRRAEKLGHDISTTLTFGW